MQLTSLTFFVFLFLAVVLYYLLPKKIRWYALLVAGGVFYCYGGFKTVWCLVMTAVTTYIGAIITENTENADYSKNRKKAIKKLIVAAVLIVNFGVLYFLKYWNYTAEVISRKGIGLPSFDILMPLGVSFFMFQSVGYVIDVYRKKEKAERNFLKYFLFVSFFPQMVQGPIGRYGELANQLTAPNEFSYDSIKKGLLLIMRGLFKKLVIADRAAIAVNAVFDGYENYPGWLIFSGVLLYCVQLYCDFSGGIDVARGAAALFKINMAENFRRPLFAVSLADFWRRWHITLGAWMKDYLFYPLALSSPFIKLGKFSRRKISGKFGKILPTSLATFIIYFVIGIWHGASFKYIAYGFWNGGIITASLLLEPFFIKLKSRLKIKGEERLYKWFCIVRTWIIVVTGRYITRAGRFMAALVMMKKTVADFSPSTISLSAFTSLGLTLSDYVVVVIGALYIFVSELMEEKGKTVSERLENKSGIIQFAAIVAAISVIVFLGIYRGDYISSEFIYKQF